MDLKAFLRENVEAVEPVKVAVSKRMKDENGAPVPWVIGCISSNEDSILRKECTKTVKKGKKQSAEFDYPAYQTKLAVKCIQFPDLADAVLQDSYGVMCAEDLLNAMLLPGEMSDLAQAVTDINGFASFEEEVDEAKN
ncbi:phage tail assembly chaperone [Scatolibacter rhodanostii]|uniref:phage tail assembly chaperone n=1 Tax=Scatolibacter rhodanostii TaxID=2014781 RepID=UPI000C071D0E|nr:phage portal protein [Scatolibacter rhodanostii]